MWALAQSPHANPRAPLTLSIQVAALALKTLRTGTIVRIEGLQTQREFNGVMGEVVSFEQPSGRYDVKAHVDGAEQVFQLLQSAGCTAGQECSGTSTCHHCATSRQGHDTARATHATCLSHDTCD